jgi:hypothetical protein
MQKYLRRIAISLLLWSAVIAALALTICVEPTLAEEAILEVPVLDLVGLYSDGVAPVSTLFPLTISPSALLSASIRLQGNLPWPSYTYGCGYNGVIFTLELPAATGSWEAEFYVDHRVNFEVIAPLASIGGATWDFLSDGEGAVICSGVARPLPPGCAYCHGCCCPIGEVTYASLLFKYDTSVPVEITTWGRIKSLYE